MLKSEVVAAEPALPVPADVAARAGSRMVASRVVPNLPAEANKSEFKIGEFVHRSLRGRYPLVIVLGLVVGIAFGAAAWRKGKPLYQSEGLVRIAYELPSGDGDLNRVRTMPNFQMFMASQKVFISSRRVIDQALQQSIWSHLKQPIPEDPNKFFTENMAVETKPGSEYIRIVVTDEKPALAAAAATAIVTAYSDLYQAQEKSRQRPVLTILDKDLGDLQFKIDQLTTDIKNKSHGSAANAEILFESAGTRVSRLEAAKLELELALINAATRPADQKKDESTTANKQPEQPRELSVEQLALVSQPVRQRIDQLQYLKDELEQMLTVRQLGDANGEVIRQKSMISKAEQRVKNEVDNYRLLQTLMGSSGVAGGPGTMAARTPAEIRDALARVETKLEESCATLRDLSEVRQMTVDLQKLEDQLKPLRERRDLQTKNELVGASRLEVVNTAEVPLAPAKDPRIKLAAAGGLVGAVLPTLLLIGFSFFFKRYRYSDETECDARANNAPLLGILPELNNGPSENREEMLSAAHSIHQVRISLNARSHEDGWRTYLVTSATAGEGKTSLTLSLGFSFAASRLRTLVIDADLIGRQLTEYFGCRNEPGLYEAMGSGDLMSRVRPSDVHPSLFILPAGIADSREACALPAAPLAALLAEARARFDVVLIDSGPILGSIEAAVLAPEVDAVVFTVTRGQQKRLVDHAIRRLTSLGGRMAGMVFNRAKSRDFHRSAFGSSSTRSTFSQPRQVPVRPLADAAAGVANPKG